MNRICPKCKIDKELTIDNYTKNSQRSNGFAYSCKDCRNKHRKGEYFKYYATKEDKKIALRIKQRNYTNNTLLGRATTLIKAYRKSDKLKNRYFEINKQWFIDNILSKPCYYCKNNTQIGADRIDNSKGHSQDNMIPCCSVCNSVRSDIFTISEMLEIGKTIMTLRRNRDINKISGNKISIIDKK